MRSLQLHFSKNIIYWILGVIGAMMTAFYMFRLYAMTFLGQFRGTHEQEHHLHESPAAMTLPLVILAILAAVGGFVGVPEVFAADSHIARTFSRPDLCGVLLRLQAAHHASHSTEYILMGVSVGLALIASIMPGAALAGNLN
jgi:NADH-quinone oxidoreductase subunit L